jgi:hypothetical protein
MVEGEKYDSEKTLAKQGCSAAQSGVVLNVMREFAPTLRDLKRPKRSLP